MDAMRAEALAEWENDDVSINAIGIKGFRTPAQKQRVAPELVIVEKESLVYTEFTADESIEDRMKREHEDLRAKMSASTLQRHSGGQVRRRALQTSMSPRS